MLQIVRYMRASFGLAVFNGFLATNAAAQESVTIELSDGRVNVQSADPRPVGAIAGALVERKGWKITYEDPPLRFEGDLVDVTNEVSRASEKARSERQPKVLIPRTEQISVTIRSEDPLKIVDAVLAAQKSTASVGRFRSFERGGYIHIVPTAVRDVIGDWKEVGSILDSPISLTQQETTARELVSNIADAVSRKRRVRIVPIWPMGGGIHDPSFGPRRYAFEAKEESARDVLLRAFDDIADEVGTLTWRLYFDPTDQAYYFNLAPAETGKDDGAAEGKH